jgi:hypothetical protein
LTVVTLSPAKIASKALVNHLARLAAPGLAGNGRGWTVPAS